MNYLAELGLQDLCDEDFFTKVVVPYAIEKGSVFNGYYGKYIWKNLGHVELNFHLIPEDGRNTVIDFTSNVSGNQMWQVAVKDTDVVDFGSDENEDDDKPFDPMTRRARFTNPVTHEGDICINLVNADVIPDLDIGDVYTMQVIEIADDVTYYSDENAYAAEPFTTLMGKPVLFAMNNIVNILAGSMAVGVVKRVRKKFSLNTKSDKVEIYAVEIDTQFGVLEIHHSEAAIKEGQKNLIRPGAVIKAIGDVLGDVAVGEYQQGAIFDKEHIIRVLHDCFTNFDFLRASQLLAADCKYIRSNGQIAAEGGKAVYEFLDGVAKSRKTDHQPLFAYLARLTGYDVPEGEASDKYQDKIGTPCIVLSHHEDGSPDTCLFITLNSDNRISCIRSAGEERGAYRITLKHVDMEDAHDFEPVVLSYSEEEWLQMIGECFEKGSFAKTEFYFGLDPDCALDSELSLSKEIEVYNRETMFTYLNEQVSHEKHETHTELIDGSRWGFVNALLVNIDGDEHVCAVSVNDGGHITILHEFLT